VVPELVTLAQDEDWHLQNQVLRYLGELHPEDPAVFACLLNALEDPKESSAESRVTARTAYEALLHWEKFPPPVRAQLQHYLLVNWSVLRLRAASILLKTERSPFALAVLCNGLSDTDSYHRTETLRCLRLHGPEARRAVPQLLTLVQQPLDELNPLAAAALWNIDQHPEALAAFTRILRAPEAGRLKIEVCAILLELRGAGLRRLLPELRQCLGRGEDHEPWERYWYKQTIAHLEAMEHQGK
jgi:HEAT repeat protein